jgi:hypothetical protein
MAAYSKVVGAECMDFRAPVSSVHVFVCVCVCMVLGVSDAKGKDIKPKFKKGISAYHNSTRLPYHP